MNRHPLQRLLRWAATIWGLFLLPLAITDAREAVAYWFAGWQLIRVWLEGEYAGLIFPFLGTLLILLSRFWPKIREFFPFKAHELRKEDDKHTLERKQHPEYAEAERPHEPQPAVAGRDIHDHTEKPRSWREIESPHGKDIKKSVILPEYCSFSIFGNLLEVGTTDAWLCTVSAPTPLLEVMPNSLQQPVLNTYIDLFFQRDDGGRFPIRLRNMMPPGAEGDRFTILWMLVNGREEFIHSVYNHSTCQWVTLNTLSELSKKIQIPPPNTTKTDVFAFLLCIIPFLLVVWLILGYFSILLLASSALFILLVLILRLVSSLRLQWLLRDLHAAVEIS